MLSAETLFLFLFLMIYRTFQREETDIFSIHNDFSCMMGISFFTLQKLILGIPIKTIVIYVFSIVSVILINLPCF